jgi:hypothetical protein
VLYSAAVPANVRRAHRLTPLAGCLVAALAACNSVLGIPEPVLDVPNDAPVQVPMPDAPPVDARPDAPPVPDATPPIVVTLVDHHHTELGTVDLLSLILFAYSYAPPAAQTTPLVIRSLGDGTGMYSVDGVKDGVVAFLNRVQVTVLATSGATLDLGFDYTGEWTGAGPTGSLVVSGTQMTPWQGVDSLVVSIPDRVISYLPMDPISDGATSVSNISVDTQNLLISGAAGARVVVEHHRTAVIDTDTAGVLLEAFVAPSFEKQSGANPVSGTFSAAQAKTLSLDWDKPSFEAAVSLMTPSAPESVDRRLGLELSAGVENIFTGPGNRPTMVDIRTNVASSTLHVSNLAFCDPYSQFWTRVVDASASVVMKYDSASITQILFLATVTTPSVGVVKPLVGPVTAVTVDGKPAQAGPIHASSTPVIKWGVPSIGSADRYLVTATSPGNTAFTMLLVAPATELQVPPKALTSGLQYVFTIRALKSAGFDPKIPLRMNVPYGYADLATSLVTID